MKEGPPIRTETFRIPVPAFPGEERERFLHGVVELRADAGAPPGPRPAVLLMHGYKAFLGRGHLPELSRRLARAGLGVVRFEFSGSGIEPGGETVTDLEAFARNTYTRELDDIARVRDALGDLPGGALDPERVGLCGTSRSGAMALLHASERPDTGAVVTWAAMSTVLRFDTGQRERWRREGGILVSGVDGGPGLQLGLELLEDAERNRERLDVVAACGRIEAPTLLLQGDRDRAVRLEELEALAAAFRAGLARTLVLEGVGHGFGARHPLGDIPPPLGLALDCTVAHFGQHLLRSR